MQTKILLAATAALLSTAAFAQPPAGGAPAGPMFPLSRADAQARTQARFAQRDANHDGFMTADELGPAAAAILERLDADHDGKVSLAEATARTLADFDAADTNHDGIVTEAEAGAMPMRGPAQPAQPATPAAPH